MGGSGSSSFTLFLFLGHQLLECKAWNSYGALTHFCSPQLLLTTTYISGKDPRTEDNSLLGSPLPYSHKFEYIICAKFEQVQY